MIFYTRQQFGQDGIPLERDGKPFMNYVLTSFDRGHVNYDGSVTHELIHCKLSFFSVDDLYSLVQRERKGIPVPDVIDEKSTKITKWSPDLTLNWKDYK